MKTILVCQLDHLGYFMGVTEADESPLEPGVYHLPGGCVEIDAPVFEHENQVARLENGEWVIEDLPEPAAAADDQPEEPGQDDPPLTAWQVSNKRREAYAVESDQLKIEAEYDAIIAGGKPNYEKWLSKVAEIKKRHPMPEEAAD